MSLIEPQRPVRAPTAPLDLVIDLHPDDVDAPAFVPAHLREMDDEPPAEATTDPEPSTTSSEESHPAPVEESSAEETEPSSTDEAGEGRKSRRKKNRRKRRRKKADAAQSVPQNSDGAGSSAVDPTPADTPPLPDNSFGNGLDS